MTFSVEPPYRRKGLGMLREAIRVSQKMGLWQLRSWSSADKTANYGLKIRFGLSFSLGEQHGVAGGQFVKNLGGYSQKD